MATKEVNPRSLAGLTIPELKVRLEAALEAQAIVSEGMNTIDPALPHSRRQFTPQYRKWQEAYSEVRRLENRIETLAMDVPGITRVVRKIVPASKTLTTAVKGWHDHTDGSTIQTNAGGDVSVSLIGHSATSKYTEVLIALKEAGYIIKSTESPKGDRLTGVRAYILITK